ncbi:glutaminyl-tRNA synthase [Ectocarpus siliculosus]|uniref:Glutaminyl-tRNA synthase n=1 Tax=Ectocarpus siliculosus TaxID=2880 RepID=D8LG69_ECTSI|nr:glutaminyl-tRNA synthase [Ectocarpus siliculosus]|eukprot:CBN78968.1 glutaminyl-tRNA synthase [Ectocarpus siliculosus]
MRSACGQARRRQRRFFSSVTADASLHSGLSLAEASRKVQEGDVRPSELAEACIKQMERSSWLNCFVTRCFDSARLEAEAADARQANGTLTGPLDGIPYAAKDNFCTLGVQTTASSAALAGFTPPYDSTPTGRLRQVGSILMGKTNMDEFGMGSGTLFSEYGRTLNPWSPESPGDEKNTEAPFLVPGGSSGGSAAAVSSGCSFAALGSDTGGSVRQPAAFCGVVGLKPTYGLIPRHGLIAYASSLDTPGVLARSILDAAMVLDVVAGPDSRDSTCIPAGKGRAGGGGFASDLLGAAAAGSSSSWPLEGVTVGIPKEFNVEELDAGVREAWENTARTAAALGAAVVEVFMPSVPQALAAYAVLASAEASSNLSRYDGLRYGARTGQTAASRGEGAAVGGGGIFRDQGELHAEITRTRTAYFGDEVKRRILTGCFVLCESAYHDYYELAIEEGTIGHR